MFKDFNFTSYKFLTITVVCFAMASFVDFFEPVGLAIKSISSKVRLHDASGEVVIVSIDDYASEHGLTTPIPAAHATNIFTTLLKAGANKIVIHEPVLVGSPEQTENLEKLLNENSQKLFISEPYQSIKNLSDTNLDSFISSPVAVHRVKTGAFWGGVEKVTYARSINGRRTIAAEVALTDVYGAMNEGFDIDYATDLNTLSYVSFDTELLRQDTTAINGKSIIVGYETSSSAQNFRIIGQGGMASEPAIIALGAETLLKGRPVDLGWVLGLCLALLLVYYMLGSSSAKWQLITAMFSFLGILTATILLDKQGISFGSDTAICLILFVTPFAVFKSSRSKVIRENGTHPDSGLPTLNALRLQPKIEKPLIVCRMDMFEELMGILSAEQRIMLAERITSLAATDSEIWHGDDGHFYWFIGEEQAANLEGHIQSLSVIMRNGFSIGHFPVSMQTVFGVDLRTDQKLSDRIMAANLAVKQAAASGDVWRIYEAADQAEAAWAITQLRELDLAIKTGEIEAYLQPKVSLQTGSTTGAEALARWTHPVRGKISPDEFVAAAESGGRIKELTIAVMRSALATAQTAIITDPEFKLSVNITPSLLADKSLCYTISSLLAQYKMHPTNLILEVTESTAFSDNETCFETMHELVSMGVTLSIDDYGKGNSTLDYLRKIPARELKIDREFISDILTSDEDSTLVQSTIRLAHKLNMKVVAEGVEDSPTLEKLRIMGCDQVQGYLICQPLSAEDFLQFIYNISRRNKTAKIR